jgi:sugar lactone lactonase YvrE
MVMGPNGDIYIADRALPIIYSKRAGEQKLTGVLASQEMVSFRGIAMQPDGRIMYVADREMGILVVDLASQRAAKLDIPANLNVGGIDGLYLWNNHLVIVQNGMSPQRVMRLALDASGTRVETVRPLAVAQPEFNFPNFGTLKGEDLVYFASTHFSNDAGQNKPVQVLRTGLDSNENLVPPEMMLYLEQQKQAGTQQEEQEKQEKSEKD